MSTEIDRTKRADRSRSSSTDREILRSLRAGEEEVFRELVDTHGPLMQRIALLYVRNRTVADEVVQETWLGVLQGIDRFEGRSSLKTWMFRILTNIAQRRAYQERRTIPLSLLTEEASTDVPSIAAERFMGGHHEWPGHWISFPKGFSSLPEERLLARETLHVAQRSIASLPPNQRTVIDLRDVHGWTSAEVCDLLDISEANQRVLLHRARSKVRQALEDYLTVA